MKKALPLSTQDFLSNVSSFYSQLAIARENAFLKMKREAEREAKKRNSATPMDVAPDARVIDVLDQRLKQLGLIGRKSKSRSRSTSSHSRSSVASQSRSRSRNQSTSPASSRGSSTSRKSSRSSSRTSRGRSRGVLKQNKSLGGLKKSVKFESRVPKNGGPTTSLQRGKGKRRGPGRGNR